jgi:hypothetical protein
MPAQERQLNLDRPLVAAQVCLVVPAGQADDFAARGPLAGADRWPGDGDAILAVAGHVQRAADAGREAARSVEADAERRACGDLLPPLRVRVAGVERFGAASSTGCCDASTKRPGR